MNCWLLRETNGLTIFLFRIHYTSLHPIISIQLTITSRPQTTTCGILESEESTARVLCVSIRAEWNTRVEHCGLLRFWCATGGSLLRVLLAHTINRVFVVEAVCYKNKHVIQIDKTLV